MWVCVWGGQCGSDEIVVQGARMGLLVPREAVFADDRRSTLGGCNNISLGIKSPLQTYEHYIFD